MSTEAGDMTSRLSAALKDIFSPDRADDIDRPDDIDERYELPEIVPATDDVPTSGAPTTIDPLLPPATRTEPVSRTATEPTSDHQRTSPAARTAPVPARPITTAPPAGPPERAPVPAPAAVLPPATSWSERVATTGQTTQLRGPKRRPRVRRVTRTLRHIDPWSTFKVALIFNAVAYVVCLTSGVLLWRVAESTGTIENVERWFTQFGWETFELQGGEIFHNAWIMGLFGVVAATGGAVLLVTLFNLVSDIVGGVRMSVLEEEVVERTVSSSRRYVVRKPTDASAPHGTPAADWSADDLDGSGPSASDTHAAMTEEWTLDDPDGGEVGNGDGTAATEPVPTTDGRTSTRQPDPPPANWSVD